MRRAPLVFSVVFFLSTILVGGIAIGIAHSNKNETIQPKKWNSKKIANEAKALEPSPNTERSQKAKEIAQQPKPIQPAEIAATKSQSDPGFELFINNAIRHMDNGDLLLAENSLVSALSACEKSDLRKAETYLQLAIVKEWRHIMSTRKLGWFDYECRGASHQIMKKMLSDDKETAILTMKIADETQSRIRAGLLKKH